MNSNEAAQMEHDLIMAKYGNEEKSIDFCTYGTKFVNSRHHRELYDVVGECY